jgi:Arc/MetJ-type ribon-helix-helix transcriptional regulator
MRQTPTFSMSRCMVQAIAQVAGRRGESMSAVVREAVRAYISLDDDDRPLPQPAGYLGAPISQPEDGRSEQTE